MRVYAWLIDFVHFRENCPTGIIPQWMQKVTRHNGIIQYMIFVATSNRKHKWPSGQFWRPHSSCPTICATSSRPTGASYSIAMSSPWTRISWASKDNKLLRQRYNFSRIWRQNWNFRFCLKQSWPFFKSLLVYTWSTNIAPLPPPPWS